MTSYPFERHSHLHAIMEKKTQLFALSAISTAVNRSLTPEEVTNAAVNKIAETMDVDTILLFVLEDGESKLKAYRGVSEGFARRVGRTGLGKEFNGQVIQTGEPLFVEDFQSDSKLLQEMVVQEGLRSLFIVPMKSGDKVVGILSVAERYLRHFTPEEKELLSLVGIILGAAIEKARFYHESNLAVRRFQELFEKAHDAIWVQDLEGETIAANPATVELTGYELDEFIGASVARGLTPKGLELAKEIKKKLLAGEKITQPYEQRAIKKNGEEAIFMLTTSLLGDEGMPRGFQHIGRDITLERQLQDELCLYIEQITRAHEDERNRIARELHDDTIQALIVISRQLDSFISKGNKVPKEVLGFLEYLRGDIDSILFRTRRFIEDLRPSTLQYLGLLPALRELISQLRKEFGCAVKFKVKGTEQHFTQQEELLLYRIVQEALRNIWKHSEATKVDVSIQFSDGRTCVTIKDNGKGFEEMKGLDLVKTGKLGIVGMTERARLLKASWAIHSKRGSGTTIMLNIPRKNGCTFMTSQLQPESQQ